MTARIRRTLIVLLGLFSTFSLPATSRALDYPNRPIRIIIGFGAGVGLDVNTRILAEMMERDLGQRILIDNRPGASGRIAANAVKGSAPDGYTLLVINNQHYTNKLVYRDISYSDEDFLPIGGGGFSMMTLAASKEVSINSVDDLVTQAKQKPGMLSYAYWGVGGSPQILARKMEELRDIKLLGVGYKDPAQANSDLISGRITVFFTSLGQALPLYSGKQINLLAVSSAQRLPNLPDVPTFQESNLSGMPSPWYGYAAPAGTPREIIERLNKAIFKAVSSPEYKQKIALSGSLPMPTETPEQLDQFIKDDFKKWEPVIRELNIKLD